MNEYLNSVWDLIDITVEDYLKRGFQNLQINFDVRAANTVAYMLQSKRQDTSVINTR